MIIPLLPQVFSKTIVCPNLEIAASYVRSHQLTAITLDGDKVDRKGALTGGYHDQHRSRLDAAKAIKRWRAAYEEDSARLEEVKRTTTQLDQEVTRTQGQVQVVKNRLRSGREGRAPMVDELRKLQAEEDEMKTRLAKLEGHKAELERDVRSLRTTIADIEKEMREPMNQDLTDEEERTLKTLTGEIDQLKRTLVEVTQAKVEVRL